MIEEYAYPASDEQALRNRYVLELAHPHLGAIKTLDFPIFMSDSPAQLRGLAPCVGQHSGKVLHETRRGEMAAMGEVPFGRYYGGVDSTPLFVLLAGAYAERTGDDALIELLWPALRNAIDKPFAEKLLHTHHGEGYRLAAPGHDAT